MSSKKKRTAAANKRVLAIGAHPDDVEFMCSGTLKLLKDRGFEVAIGVIANGDCGSMVESQKEITRIRRQEAINAAKLLDAHFYPMGELDLKVEYNSRTTLKVTEVIRTVDPLIVFTHPHEDYMLDHEMASRVVRMACFGAPVPNFQTEALWPHPISEQTPFLYYWAPLLGRDIYGKFVEQSIYVNVTDTVQFKEKMLACHASQRDWLMKQHAMDKYIETMKHMAVEYGNRCGFAHAEGFIQHLGNGYPHENILEELLGNLVKAG
jgi:LmbE family N-acetylglucosaminyl deacetylase